MAGALSLVGDRLDALRRRSDAAQATGAAQLALATEQLRREQEAGGSRVGALSDDVARARDALACAQRRDVENDYLFDVMPILRELGETTAAAAAVEAAPPAASSDEPAATGGADVVRRTFTLRVPARRVVKRRGKTVGAATLPTKSALTVLVKRRAPTDAVERRLLDAGAANKAQRTTLATAMGADDAVETAAAATADAAADPRVCPACGKATVTVDLNAQLVCTSCGGCAPVVMSGTSATAPFVDATSGIGVTYEQRLDVRRPSNYAYQPLKHFTDWLDKSQGKERPVTPQPILDGVGACFRRDRIVDPRLMTPRRVKLYLKQLGLARYYDHAVQIAHRLSGIEPLRFTDEQEAYLCARFVDVYGAWEATKQWRRQNFFSYAYAIHKLLQLCQYPRAFFAQYPLLKSPDKRYAQDQMWRRVCTRLNWRFIPSHD